MRITEVNIEYIKGMILGDRRITIREIDYLWVPKLLTFTENSASRKVTTMIYRGRIRFLP